MANNRTLTSANAILMIGAEQLFPAAVRIQGFSADDVTDMDAIEQVETAMGIDGRLSAGFVPVPVRQNITLQADSKSNDMFELWANFERANKEKYVAFGTLILPAVDRQYILVRGFLRSYSPMPGARRSLQPRRYSIEWEKVIPAPKL